ncbi:5-formyltetrahydrofolate cyclo-ligase [Dysgonomonas massiliensis]|uniref:5-formyltetrahydrofolate cyclo-ligase n=1 Tax=Dysgonomonas massiliensis TaxID=2040292 RepID=UPI001FE33274|nr:5-formyltetrahydrofolate cyclo-ligase [Dysgonomonas massiliensis]
MENIQEQKKLIRKQIKEAKMRYTSLELERLSSVIMSRLETHPAFVKAKRILIYNNMPDEVATMDLVHRWMNEKEFYLPVVVGNEMVFRRYEGTQALIVSDYGIEEPLGADFTDFDSVDLIVVPGLAFDKDGHRLGRGKGFYDRFLPKVSKAVKIGVCFDFQLVESVPLSAEDIDMDIIISDVHPV